MRRLGGVWGRILTAAPSSSIGPRWVVQCRGGTIRAGGGEERILGAAELPFAQEMGHRWGSSREKQEPPEQ